jgi:hypothetical protein
MGWQMNRYYIFLTAVLMVFAYQNCSNTASFEADKSLVAKTDVSVQDDGTNTYDGVIDEIADEMPSDPSAPPPTNPVVNEPVTPPPTNVGASPSPAPMPAPSPAPGYAGRGNNGGGDNGHSGSSNNPNDKEDSSQFVCILNGSGNSTRLGQTSGSLTADTSAVNDVCMSEKACLEIVVKAFEVKGAEMRGYCKSSSGNPNVVRMSDKEVEDAINAELLKRIVSAK